MSKARQSIKYAVLFAAVVLALPSFVLAQDTVDATSEAPTAVEQPAVEQPAVEQPAVEQPAVEQPAVEQPAEAKKKKGPYYKKVQGLLWFEGLVGATSFDPDKFGGISLTGGTGEDAPKVRGPEWGLAIGVGLGGFYLGGFYRQAHYDAYKLGKIGLDIQGILRFIPYVHPMFRADLFYAKMFSGSPYPSLTNVNTNGGGATLGAGVMIPIIRYLSFTATFDWSWMGFAIGGDPVGGGSRVNEGIAGQQFGATFALTVHLIGVRAN
jgi:hypothetical protein